MASETFPAPELPSRTVEATKSNAPEVLDIGWACGRFRDGRPFRLECWAQDQATFLNFFFSAIGLEELSNDDLKVLLTSEDLINFVGEEQYLGSTRWRDASDNDMWNVSVVVGDDQQLFAQCSCPLTPYSR